MKKSEEYYIKQIQDGLNIIRDRFYELGDKAMGDFSVGLWWFAHYLKNDLNRVDGIVQKEIIDFTTPKNDEIGTEIEFLEGTFNPVNLFNQENGNDHEQAE